jgi:hypothetical protein
MTKRLSTLNIRPLFLVLLLVAAGAQADWFSKGKELLEGFDSSGSSGSLSDGEIGSGLKEALSVSTVAVVSQLGQVGGFNDDPAIHIPLPGTLKSVQSTLSKLGMGSMLDDLELRLNRAAEMATPKAKRLFLDAISDMTLEDVRGILNGPDDAATRYFQKKMTPGLIKEMRPIVDESLAEAGAVKAYDRTMGEYNSLPFVPDAKANLTDYVLEKGTDGIFHYIAEEEAAIRNNPAKRTTELLRKVFSN